MVTTVGGYKLKDKYGHIQKSHFPPRQVKRYYLRMPVADDKDPIPTAYTSPELTGLHADVDICTAESVKDSHKQITIVDLLRPILMNTEDGSIAIDMEQVVIIDIVHDAEMLKNELVEDEPPLAFENQTLKASDTNL